MQPKAIINLKSLRHNINFIKSIVSPNTKMMPVVKANAYGHGYSEIVKVLKEEGIQCVCVATAREVQEILDLNLNINILHLGKISKDLINMYNNKYVIATINSIDDVKTINDINLGIIRCHIKVNTGMNRMGCNLSEFDFIFKELSQLSNVNIEGVYSHLACSYNVKSKYNKFQIDNFSNIINRYKKLSLCYHLLSTGGMINYPDYHLSGVRCGLSLYGVSYFNHVNKSLKPVMKFLAPIALIKYIDKGEKVGYDCTYISNKKTKIALVQSGYADGVPLEFGNKGFVYYDDKKLPILGKVSMDLICVDCTGVNIKEGDFVCLWGDENVAETSLNIISDNFKSIPYLYLTNVSNRVKRVYLDD